MIVGTANFKQHQMMELVPDSSSNKTYNAKAVTLSAPTPNVSYCNYFIKTGCIFKIHLQWSRNYLHEELVQDQNAKIQKPLIFD